MVEVMGIMLKEIVHKADIENAIRYGTESTQHTYILLRWYLLAKRPSKVFSQDSQRNCQGDWQSDFGKI